ncbi:hypothetical protein [Dactylosporangium sp. NPDC000521]|uniref:hypothetical protein n=1 Tax=Dactylosporangium sp. NPDC000521 TaxID=3363975 RepID=UPI003682AE9B
MIERRIFGLTRTLQVAVAGDVQRILMSADPGDDPSYTWRDDERGVAVVVSVIDADHCQVALLDGGRWHDLVDSDDPTLAWVSLTGTPGVVPLASILPCRFAVDALETVTIGAGFDHLRATRRWRPAPAWVDDRDGVLLRDLVEVLWNTAGDLWLRVAVEGPAADHGPIGLRHLARMHGLHSRAMAGGLGSVSADFPPDWIDAAVRAGDYLGLTGLRAVLRDADDAAYDRLASPAGDDGGAIRAAVQRKLDTVPEEFGVTDVPGRAITEFLAGPGRVR